jgi:hypothetical protein
MGVGGVILLFDQYFRWTGGIFGKNDIFENVRVQIYGFSGFSVSMAMDIDPSIGCRVDMFSPLSENR